jgi:hypothetical protein
MIRPLASVFLWNKIPIIQPNCPNYSNIGLRFGSVLLKD